MNKVFLKIVVCFSFLIILLVFIVDVEAEEDGNLNGYAWSDAIGWVSFNYGTNIDYDGYISGYAWSDALGWISFNASDLVGCPTIPCSARFDRDSRNISGWAKDLGSSNPWIMLGPINFNGNNYGLSYDYNSRNVLGYAWSDAIGWISFNCINENECGNSNYGVKHDPSIKADNLYVSMSYCMHDEDDYPKVNTGLVVRLNWEYFSTIDTQGGYIIEISDDPNFVNNVFTQNFNDNSNNSMWLNLAGSGWNEEKLNWGTTYYWRIKVQGVEGGWSEWATSSFGTQSHASPRVLFSSIPPYYIIGEEVEFIAGKDGEDSRTYDGSQPIYEWIFLGGTPSTSNQYSQIVVFDGSEEETNVVLKVIDSDGYFCQKSKNSYVYNFTAPIWKDISPF
jgi:hypothetical protein